MIPLSAWIFNNFRSKNSYRIMLTTFMIGSFVCFIAPDFPILLIGRIVQALAAGALMPFIQNIVLSIFPPQKRGLGLGITGLVIAFAPAIGPSIAGLILKAFSWRILFLILGVLDIIVLIFTFCYSRNLNQVHHSKLDFLSLLWSTFGFGCLLYAFSALGNSGEVNLSGIVTFILGIIFIIIFCIRQNHLTRPLVNLKVFTNSTFNLSTILSTLSMFALLGMELIIPLYLQNVHSVSALMTGLILIPGAIITGIANPITGVLFDKIGAKRVSLIGFGLLTIGTLPMINFNTSTNLLWIMFWYALRLLGIAFVFMNDFTAGINALSPKLKAHGNAASSTIRQIGSSLGTALSMTAVTIGVKVSYNVSKINSLTYDVRRCNNWISLSFWLPKKANKQE